MKTLFTFAFIFFFSQHFFAQLLSGDLLDDNRRMLSSFDFVVHGKYSGSQYYELAVNPEGIVTGIRSLEREGALISTPAKILAEKELNKLTFEKGTRYPKFHHVTVKITFEKGKKPGE